MKISHLSKDVLYMALAKTCTEYDAEGEDSCFANTHNIECPFGYRDDGWDCQNIESYHWREVFEGKDEDELRHRFTFGDKVSVNIVGVMHKAIYIAKETTENGGRMAYIVIEGKTSCSCILASRLIAGWRE